MLDTLWQFNISIIEHDHLHLPIKHADFPSQTASLPEGNVGTSLFDLSNHPVLGTRVNGVLPFGPAKIQSWGIPSGQPARAHDDLWNAGF